MRYVENLTSVEGGYGRTGSRSPMQWDGTPNAGFGSSAPEKLYIPIDSDADRPTVEKQAADSSSVYSEVRRLIEIRQSHKALQSCGEIEFVYAEENAYPLAYIRSCGEEKILVIINPSDKEQKFSCNYPVSTALYSIGGNADCSDGVITVPPCFAGFYGG